MADFVFNIAKGKVAEYVARVAGNDPSASQLVLVPLSASGSQATIQDLDTLSAVLGGGATERTTGGWVRKNGRDTGGDFVVSAPAVDDTNDRMPAALPQVTWTTPAAANNTTGLLVCYDADSAAGTDANVIPLTYHDFAVTTDGNDVILNAGDFFRAT